jgi:hypothetical protein
MKLFKSSNKKNPPLIPLKYEDKQEKPDECSNNTRSNSELKNKPKHRSEG